MDDLISRQAAIDALHMHLMYRMGTDSNKKRLDDWINGVPSVQPEQRWIPCSKRLPEPRMAVLGYAPRYENIYALYYDSVMGWMIWNPIRDDCLPNSQGEIVAWMPLPEPYQEGEQDENR